MKKLALAIVGLAGVVSAANANIGTGFYLGAAGGYGSTVGKYTQQGTLGGNGAPAQPGAGVNGSIDIGGNAANLGAFVGYGWVQNCLYFGGEFGYTFENTKINDTLGQATGRHAAILKRSGYFNVALRGGYLFTPNTMLYIRLGTNWGKWKLDDSLNAFNQANPGSGSKNRMSFAPGVGLETAVHKNVYVRVEYTYEYGPSVRARSTNAGFTNNYANVGSIRSQSAKLGVAYKF